MHKEKVLNLREEQSGAGTEAGADMSSGFNPVEYSE